MNPSVSESVSRLSEQLVLGGVKHGGEPAVDVEPAQDGLYVVTRSSLGVSSSDAPEPIPRTAGV